MKEKQLTDMEPMRAMTSFIRMSLSNRSNRELMRYAEEETVEALKDMIDFNSYTLVAETCAICHHSYSQLCRKLAELDPECADQYAALNLTHGQNAFDIVKSGRRERRRR